MTGKQHTPTPWEESGDVAGALVASSRPRDNLLGLNVEGYAIVMEPGDVAFIVRAVNSYDGLVEALAHLEDVVSSQSCISGDCNAVYTDQPETAEACAKARAVLEKAKRA